MNDTAWSLAPALGLLLLLAGLAWGAHWLKRRLEPTGSGQGAGVRLPVPGARHATGRNPGLF
jgi:hypothetical protein